MGICVVTSAVIPLFLFDGTNCDCDLRYPRVNVSLCSCRDSGSPQFHHRLQFLYRPIHFVRLIAFVAPSCLPVAFHGAGLRCSRLRVRLDFSSLYAWVSPTFSFSTSSIFLSQLRGTACISILDVFFGPWRGQNQNHNPRAARHCISIPYLGPPHFSEFSVCFFCFDGLNVLGT